ncbi:putative RNA-directed DNA polymerase, eukaryota, reverse transcriptase zinc-binding domain protein [Tanacetum coccineum]
MPSWARILLLSRRVLKVFPYPYHSRRSGENHIHVPVRNLRVQTNAVRIIQRLDNLSTLYDSIFYELIEDSMEVFIDDFSVFGSSFDHCLKNLEKVLKRCEETNLVLNWEKFHFMLRKPKDSLYENFSSCLIPGISIVLHNPFISNLSTFKNNSRFKDDQGVRSGHYPSGHSAFVLWIMRELLPSMTISVQLQHNLNIRLLLLLQKSDRCFGEYHKLILIVLSSGSIGTSFILKKKGLKKASTTTSFGDGEMELGSHLSTIRTLHAWEKKLYDEVNVHIRSIDNNGVNCVRDNEIDKGISPLESAAKIQPWYVTAWNSLGKARDVLKDKLTTLEALCVQYKVEFRTNVSIVAKALQPPLLPATPVTALELLRDGFDDLIKSEWDLLDSNTSEFPIKCHEKFRILKAKIRHWNNNNKTMDRNRKAVALEEITSIEKKIDEGSASPSDTENRLDLLHELEKIDKLASMDLIQKARVKWDIEGDENLKFFHGLINQKRRNQIINGIMVEGTWTTDPSLIKDAFFQFYKDKFQAQDSQVLFPNLPHSHTLNSTEQDYLERLVTLEEIKEADLYDFINSFFASSELPCGANSSFFTLIPKVNNPTLITDFRLISLIGIHYKIIAKILANRLSKVIDKIVSKEQSTFIAGRQILDGPIILNEIIEWHKKRKKQLLIFKVDFEKAFDSISWKYLDHILDRLGFGYKWCSWIKACLSSSRASILVNGSPTSEFSINRGLRQGDPLSPFLFILVMEGLHNAFAEAVGNGLISGININNSTINISHLFFVDDVIITTDWNTRDLENIIRVFHVFYLASGLKINIHKSNIYGIGVNEEEVSNMASNAGCIAGGRLTLIKSVLGGLGIYYLSIFRAPESVIQDLERIRSNFFWGGNQDGKKMAWVKWPIILNSFDKGGLNIGSLKAFNLVLLQKWRWRMFFSPNDLWVKVVKAFHGHEGGFDNNDCSFKGCRTRIHFWKDIWVGEAHLFTRYNRIYRLDQDKDCFIIGRINNGQWHWNWSRTNLGVRNLAYFCDMLNEIGQVNIEVSEDTCVWSLGPKGTFTVKDARNIIDQKTLPSLAPSTTWDKTIPRKVNIFMCRLSLDRLPHRLNLSLRGMDIPAISCSS